MNEFNEISCKDASWIRWFMGFCYNPPNIQPIRTEEPKEKSDQPKTSFTSSKSLKQLLAEVLKPKWGIL